MAALLYLFQFGYAEPAEIAWVERHPDADLGECSEAVFVRAPSEEEALRLGADVADAFVRVLFRAEAYDWRAGLYASSVELEGDAVDAARAIGVPVVTSGDDVSRAAAELAARRAARRA